MKRRRRRLRLRRRARRATFKCPAAWCWWSSSRRRRERRQWWRAGEDIALPVAAAAGSGRQQLSGPGSSAAGTGGSNQRSSSSSAPGGFSGNVPRTEGKSRAMAAAQRGWKAERCKYLSSHLTSWLLATSGPPSSCLSPHKQHKDICRTDAARNIAVPTTDL